MTEHCQVVVAVNSREIPVSCIICLPCCSLLCGSGGRTHAAIKVWHGVFQTNKISRYPWVGPKLLIPVLSAVFGNFCATWHVMKLGSASSALREKQGCMNRTVVDEFTIRASSVAQTNPVFPTTTALIGCWWSLISVLRYQYAIALPPTFILDFPSVHEMAMCIALKLEERATTIAESEGDPSDRGLHPSRCPKAAPANGQNHQLPTSKK